MNFLPFVDSLLLCFCVTLANFVKMVCEQICTSFDLPALANYVWFMWVALTVHATSMIIKFLLKTKDEFLFDKIEVLPNPSENTVINESKSIRYRVCSRLSNGTEIKEDIKKKWKSADGSWNSRARRVSCLPDPSTKMEPTNKRQHSNRKIKKAVRNKADAGYKAVSRVTDFKVKAKSTPTQRDSYQQKPNVKVSRSARHKTKLNGI